MLSEESLSSVCKHGKEALVEALGSKVRLLPLRSHINPEKGLVALADRQAAFRRLEGWFLRRGYYDKRVVKAIAIPPAIEGGKLWSYGYATRMCAYKHISPIAAFVAQKRKSSYAKIAMLHEIGHLLCADHDNSLPATIMHANALAYADQALTFSSLSIAQMRYGIE